MNADGASVGNRGGELGGDGMSEHAGVGAVEGRRPVRERVSMLRERPVVGAQVAKF